MTNQVNELQKDISKKTTPTNVAFNETSKTDSPMWDLLQKVEVKLPQIGDVITGTVIEMGKNTVYLDLGVLGTGIVMGRELKDGLGLAGDLEPGDEVEAAVIDLENEDGYMELSLREAGYDKTWEELERKKTDGDIVQTKILAANRGGLMVEIHGITGFLPVSQLSNENYPRVEDGDKNKILQLLERFVSQNLPVKIIDVDREEEKLIVSEKATLSEKEEKEIKKFKIGDSIEGIVSGIVDFGAFVKFPPAGQEFEKTDPKDMLEGLVHISELAWQLIENPRDIVKVGEKVKCKIIGVDNNRISLSIRALQKDPWSQVETKYKVGQIVKGEITKLNPFGAFVNLDADIHGLAHISELNRAAAPKNVEDVFKAPETYEFKILSIDSRHHRMGLAPLSEKDKEKGKKEDSDSDSKAKKDSAKKEEAKDQKTAEKAEQEAKDKPVQKEKPKKEKTEKAEKTAEKTEKKAKKETKKKAGAKKES